MSATEIERIVCGAIAKEITKRVEARCHQGELGSDAIARLQHAGSAAISVLERSSGSEQRALLLSLVGRIDLSGAEVAIELRLKPIDELLIADEAIPVRSALPPALIRIGKQAKLLLPAEAGSVSADSNLVKLLARAFAVRKAILESGSLDAAAMRFGYGRDYAVALARVSYLAPHIVQAILAGTQPATLGSTRLARMPNLPYRWDQQSALLGFA